MTEGLEYGSGVSRLSPIYRDNFGFPFIVDKRLGKPAVILFSPRFARYELQLQFMQDGNYFSVGFAGSVVCWKNYLDRLALTRRFFIRSLSSLVSNYANLKKIIIS